MRLVYGLHYMQVVSVHMLICMISPVPAKSDLSAAGLSIVRRVSCPPCYQTKIVTFKGAIANIGGRSRHPPHSRPLNPRVSPHRHCTDSMLIAAAKVWTNEPCKLSDHSSCKMRQLLTKQHRNINPFPSLLPTRLSSLSCPTARSSVKTICRL